MGYGDKKVVYGQGSVARQGFLLFLKHTGASDDLPVPINNPERR